MFHLRKKWHKKIYKPTQTNSDIHENSTRFKGEGAFNVKRCVVWVVRSVRTTRGVAEVVWDQNHILVLGSVFCSVNCEYTRFFFQRVCVAYFRRSESVHERDRFSSKLKTFTTCLSLTDAKQVHTFTIRNVRTPRRLVHLVVTTPASQAARVPFPWSASPWSSWKMYPCP